MTILDVRVGLWTVLTDCRMATLLRSWYRTIRKPGFSKRREKVQQLMAADDLQLVQHIHKCKNLAYICVMVTIQSYVLYRTLGHI